MTKPGKVDALVAERFDVGAKRSIAEQDQLRTELVGKPAEGIDHDVRLFLAVEAAGVDEQRLVVLDAEPAAKRGIALVRSELADLDPERRDRDPFDSDRAQFFAPPASLSARRVETAEERAR